MRVPVFCGARVIELAGPERVRQLAKAPNAEIVRKRKTRQIVQVNLISHGDDSEQPGRNANPRRYSHDHETEENPNGVWTLRHLPRCAEPVFRAAILDCLSARTPDST